MATPVIIDDKWINENLISLIRKIKDYPDIWDGRRSGGTKTDRATAWSKIATSLRSDFESWPQETKNQFITLLKNKWHKTRDHFQKCWKGDKTFKKRDPTLHQEMSFLVPVLEQDKSLQKEGGNSKVSTIPENPNYLDTSLEATHYEANSDSKSTVDDTSFRLKKTPTFDPKDVCEVVTSSDDDSNIGEPSIAKRPRSLDDEKIKDKQQSFLNFIEPLTAQFNLAQNINFSLEILPLLQIHLRDEKEDFNVDLNGFNSRALRVLLSTEEELEPGKRFNLMAQIMNAVNKTITDEPNVKP